MFDMKIGFSFMGVIIFLLPMLINIVYFVLGGNEATQTVADSYKWIEIVEQSTRILYAIAICFLVSKQQVNFKSPVMILGILFLVLYYIVWMRYFMGGMDISLLGKSFLGIPLPLAIFPVLYFICAALWMRNGIALGCMIVFGIAHYVVSYFSLK